MKIIAVERELKRLSGDNVSDVYKNEAGRVFALYQEGVIREIYLTEERCAVIVLECGSIEEARQILDTLPLVQAGVIAFEVHELKPFKGYERLIRE